MPIKWQMAKEIVVYINVMGYYCAVTNNECDKYREIWKDLHILMQSEVKQSQETTYTMTTTTEMKITTDKKKSKVNVAKLER